VSIEYSIVAGAVPKLLFVQGHHSNAMRSFVCVSRDVPRVVQLVTKVDDDMVDAIEATDALVASGNFESRSAVSRSESAQHLNRPAQRQRPDRDRVRRVERARSAR
jgi:hypothetical protein